MELIDYQYRKFSFFEISIGCLMFIFKKYGQEMVVMELKDDDIWAHQLKENVVNLLFILLLKKKKKKLEVLEKIIEELLFDIPEVFSSEALDENNKNTLINL